MARAAGSKDYTGFVKGLVTEASQLSFPDGATSDELNFVLDSDGQKRVKRKGLEIISDYTRDDGVTAGPFSNIYELGEPTYWRKPNLIIIPYQVQIDATQTNVRYIFFDADDFTVKGTFAVADVDLQNTTAHVAIVDTLAIMTIGDSRQQLVAEYVQDAGNVTVSSFSIYIRDFELLDDGLGVDVRPTTLSDDHEYNLNSAGWWPFRRASDTNNFETPVTTFNRQSPDNDYPSNADIALIGVKTNGAGDSVFDYDTLNETRLGTTEAPRGYYVYELSDRDRENRRLNPDFAGVPSSTVDPTPIYTFTV